MIDIVVIGLAIACFVVAEHKHGWRLFKKWHGEAELWGFAGLALLFAALVMLSR